MKALTSSPRIPADQRGLIHLELTEKVIGILYDVSNELGHGFLESVHEQTLAVALAEQQVLFHRQIAIAVWFRGHQDDNFCADLLAGDKLIVELKAGPAIEAAWEKPLLDYLKATEIEAGILLNFGPALPFRHLVFENERKKIRVHPRESEKRSTND